VPVTLNVATLSLAGPTQVATLLHPGATAKAGGAVGPGTLTTTIPEPPLPLAVHQLPPPPPPRLACPGSPPVCPL